MVRTVLAYAATYLLWGSTFLGIRIAVQEMEPFSMAAARFLLAGLIVLVLVRTMPRLRKGRALPWPKAAITGAFYTLGTHGIISHIARDTPSGTIAVLMATVPLMAALAGWALGEQRPTMSVTLGIGLGIGGVALLAWPGGVLSVATTGWLLGAAACWTAGSILTQRWATGVAPVPMAGRQMLAGGALLLFVAGITGEGWMPVPLTWTSLAAVAFLSIGGTILAYLSYLHLMARSSVTKASSYTFVNPVVAVFLGALIGGEAVTERLLLATPFIVAAVVLVLRAKQAPTTTSASHEPATCARCTAMDG